MMKFEFLVPVSLNDGTPVPESTMNFVSHRLALLCGGSSVDESLVRGIWFGANNQRFDDTCQRFFVAADKSRLTELLDLVREIGRDLQQEAMFVEVSGYDGPQILNIH